MNDAGDPGRGEPRWEYRLVWRYGPFSMVVVGLALLGIGASGLCATAISVTLLPIALVCFVAGVVLPRIEGNFTAGPQGISAPLLAVHKIDTYTVTGPALESGQVPALPAGTGAGPVLLGDVWDALIEKLEAGDGIRSLGAAGGRHLLQMPDGRVFELTNQGFLDWRPASAELLDLLAQWGVRPVASGKYPAPDHLDPSKATGPVSARLIRGGDGSPASR